MGDMEELKSLVEKQLRENIAAQKRVDDLIEAIARAPLPHEHATALEGDAARAAAAVTRAEKVSKLGIALRKSYKVKEYKDNHEGSIKEWLTRFDQECMILKKMCGINNDLSVDEIVELFKDKIGVRSGQETGHCICSKGGTVDMGGYDI